MEQTGSILTDVKKLLGITEEYEHFDTDIIIHINSAFFTLNQLGLGPVEGFSISDKTATWGDFLSDARDLEAVKTYVYLKTRIVFDPPTSSAVMESIKNMINELEWRLNVAVDPPSNSGEVE